MALLTRADLKWQLTCPYDHYDRLSDLCAGELRQMMRVSGFWRLFSNVVAPVWVDPFPCDGSHPPPWYSEAAKIDMGMRFHPLAWEYSWHHHLLLAELETTRVASFQLRTILRTVESHCRHALQERLAEQPLPEIQLRLLQQAANVVYSTDLDRNFRAIRHHLQLMVGFPWVEFGHMPERPHVERPYLRRGEGVLRGQTRRQLKSKLDENINNCLMEAGKPSWCKGEYNPK